MLPAWPQERTLLEYAAALDLGVLINRPLNAIQEGDLIRLDEDVYDAEGRAAARRFYEDAAKLNSSWGEAPHLRHLALRSLRSPSLANSASSFALLRASLLGSSALVCA